MADTEMFLENTIKIECEIKQELPDNCNDCGEEYFMESFSEVAKCTGLETRNERDSDEEELKPPVAVWVKEEAVYSTEEKELEDEEADSNAPLHAQISENGLFLLGAGSERCTPEDQVQTQLSPRNTVGKSEALLDRPVRILHPKERHVCTVCGRIFRFQSPLVVHMRTHSGENPYVCSVCQKDFSKKSNLDAHTLTHTGRKQYECSYCERKFLMLAHLIKHKRTHSGERPHTCSVCERRFSLKGSLVDHMQTHTGEKPYVCSVCQKGFSKKNNLDGHMLTHTGTKEYECSYCGILFLKMGHLIMHERTHTGNRPHILLFS